MRKRNQAKRNLKYDEKKRTQKKKDVEIKSTESNEDSTDFGWETFFVNSRFEMLYMILFFRHCFFYEEKIQ